MKKVTHFLFLTGIYLLSLPLLTYAQTSNVYIDNTDQSIRGFGGMNFPRWIADLSPDAVNKAFGNGDGQIGLSILRISVSPNSSQWNLEVPTAQRAANQGAIVFATPWSPPASMKTNNSTIRGELSTSQYGAYANYLRDFTNYMSSNGVSLYAISVQNEPDWLPNYESCGWSGTQIRNFLDNNASVIPTKVMAPETVHYKGNYMSAIASSSQVDILANHAYGGSPTRYNSSKEQWMTEHYAPNSNSNSANNWPEALEAGKEIHDYLINGYNAYVWWYIRRSYGLITEDGNVSKRGFVMSHYSKFVRPGYVRVRSDATPTSGVSVSSYRDGNTLVVVAINQNSSSSNLTLNFSGYNVSNITKWETTGSTGNNVSEVGTYSGGTSFSNSLTGHSITTFRGTIGGVSVTNEVWLEAECGNVGSLWNTSQSNTASNGEYVTIQSGNNSTGSAPGNTNGHITYDFNISTGGTYTLWARVQAPTASDDSFWIRMDGGSWINWNSIAPGSTTWTWDDVTSYSLGTGNHTLTVAYREDGTDLDKLYLTTASSPSGTGGSAANCGSSGSNVTIRARGTQGSEQIQLVANGSTVNSWTLSTTYQDYTATASGSIEVHFVNDSGSPDVQIDYAQIGGTTYQAEDQSTNTGVWQNSSCGGSNSEWLHCNGYIAFTNASSRMLNHENLSEVGTQDLLYYPNPMKNTLTLELEDQTDWYRGRIYGLSGQLFIDYQLTGVNHQIDVSSLPGGIYFLELIGTSKTQRIRLIKE